MALSGLAGVPGLGVIIVVAIVIAVLVVTARRLGTIDSADAPLSPLTQRRFTHFTAALLMCTAVAPTFAFWTDALALTSAGRDAGAYRAAVEAVDERNRQTAAIQQAFYGFDHDHRRPSADEGAGVFPPVGDSPAAASKPLVLVSAAIRSLQDSLSDPVAVLCDADTTGAICNAAPVAITGRHLPRAYLAGLAPSAAMLLRLIAISALALGMVAGLAWFTRRIFRSLLGFEVALAPAQLPMLWLGTTANPDPHKYNELGAKSLLVAPQRALREWVLNGDKAKLVDLVSATGKTAGADGIERWPPPPEWDNRTRIVAFGLELILRDPERRRAALAILERLAADAGAQRSGKSLVVISDRAPLDRILDAFDIEKQRSDTEASATQKAREELRWARLFQDFATFNFAPVDKIDNKAATLMVKRLAHVRKWPRATRQGIAVLIDEMRWLPGSVIAGATFRDLEFEDHGGRFPVAAKAYRNAYTAPVTRWACEMQPASPEAAIDYAWGAVIEYYQQCWSSSTHSERLVLDALAKGRFVNFVAALALKSLVRRGLVVLDPAPRLMNASFAAFVRQAERPETLATWRVEQPDGGWAAARLPIGIGLAAMVVALAFIIGSDQNLAAMVPLLAAGAPALTTTFANLFRRS
ncbi:hypothetical protein [Sandarakinorhabdus glacialis]|uniref:hypothetical protein n=1 Tax=Sandarakinorhabdus glacialis TaxID=1614636 RepID=UPI00166338CE|nr:hypothetical protein [Polymorphobacter glacialis]